MINLLPPQQKIEILGDRKYGVFLIIGILFLVFWVSFSLLLLSIEIRISSQASSQRIIADSEEEKLLTEEINSTIKEMELMNRDIAGLKSFYARQASPTALLEKVSRILPSGVYLASFSFTSPAVSFIGYSPTRDLLYELKKNLEAEPAFENINFPASNWVKQKDINFSVSFRVKPQ